MMNLVLSVCFSTSLFVIFKYFDRFKIDTLQAIVVNYVVAFVLGMASANAFGKLGTVPEQPWLLGAIFLGLLFVSIFFVMALTAQRNGVGVASIAGKMSLVVPILFGIVLYNESAGVLKLIGIIIALIAVYLSSVKEGKSGKGGNLIFPVLLFLGSGVIDTTLKYVETNFVSQHDVDFFSGCLFGFAALFGILVLLGQLLVKRPKFQWKNLMAGIVLGIPNYYSIFFLIKALQNKNFESSELFTFNNVGVVILSTVVGVVLFKERLSKKNLIGVALAIIGIVLVANANG
jgi:drug/metabolite transporter (DMT)-like permease